MVYYKKDGKLVHQFYVFVSNEPQHDIKFVFALLKKLVPVLFQLVADLKFVHYWKDLPTSQYRNKTIFKVVSCHQEYFNIPASWSYMESGHGKGFCDPIGETAKWKPDIAVKNDKAVIQDSNDFYNWAKDNEIVIKFYFVTPTECENAANFLTKVCENVKSVAGNMKLHAVLPHSPNKFWVRNTSYFNNCCFNDNSFQPQPNISCQCWRLIRLNRKTSDSPQKLLNSDDVLLNLNDYVAAVYGVDKKVYIGKVIDVDQTDINVNVLKHKGEISRNSAFVEPRKKDEILVELRNLSCILPVPLETKNQAKNSAGMYW